MNLDSLVSVSQLDSLISVTQKEAPKTDGLELHVKLDFFTMFLFFIGVGIYMLYKELKNVD